MVVDDGLLNIAYMMLNFFSMNILKLRNREVLFSVKESAKMEEEQQKVWKQQAD